MAATLAILIALMIRDVEPRKADGVTVLAPSMEVVVVQIGADGKPVLACVEGKETARRLVETPAARIPSLEPKEQ